LVVTVGAVTWAFGITAGLLALVLAVVVLVVIIERPP
jgi:hypothetical protein